MAMTSRLSRPLATLVPPELAARLAPFGFACIDDLRDMTPPLLVDETNSAISLAEAAAILDAVQAALMPPAPLVLLGGPDASPLAEARQPCLSTGSVALDALFDHSQPSIPGLVPGHVYEITGAPGVGVTTLCMNLCVRVQLSPDLGGLGGRALWIDTEGGLLASRLDEIALSTITVHKLQGTSSSTLLDNIAVVRVFDAIELVAQVELLGADLANNAGIRLIVVDSIWFLFEGLSRARQDVAARVVAHLKVLAQTHSVIVVLTSKFAPKSQTLAAGNDLYAAAAPVAAQQRVAVEDAVAAALAGAGHDLRESARRIEAVVPVHVPATVDRWRRAVSMHVVMFWERESRVARRWGRDCAIGDPVLIPPASPRH
ncbi:P-loop containing nucleoside triphosphate hydrolase protein [Blastocladiella britannica]|nr:P-loop containing nucleoside triphosphate hydrolase protein [Blastocladiella britannica]